MTSPPIKRHRPCDAPHQHAQAGPSSSATFKSVGTVLDTCVICLSNITERAVSYPCNHLAFDYMCLVSWLEQRPTCPLCNKQVHHVEYDWRSPTDYKRYTLPKSSPAPSSGSNNLRNARHMQPGANRVGPTRRTIRRTIRRTAEGPRNHEAALERRRMVHARNKFSLHRAPSSSRSMPTPAAFRASPEMQRKARTFLRRELQVWTYLRTTSRLEFVLEYVVGMLRKLELKGADGAMETLLKEIVGRDGARLLMHELGAFLSSRLDRLEDWDRAVQYDDADIMWMADSFPASKTRQGIAGD